DDDPSNPQRGIANSQNPWVFVLGQRHRRRRSGPRLRPGLHRRLGPWASGGWPCHYRPIPLTVASTSQLAHAASGKTGGRHYTKKNPGGKVFVPPGRVVRV